jgi:hypothetical protein
MQHESRFARAVRSHQRDLLSGTHIEGDAAQCRAAIMIGKMQIVNM